MVIAGVMTRQIAERVKRIYEQMPEPKFVVAVGACALTGGVFQNCYGQAMRVDQVIPVDVYVPGCPPKPEAIIDGVVKLLGKVGGGGSQ
jgi:NADH:ubiquinone oxidoreductase subunit B-like Fe-S oxidoreductase